MAPILRPTGAVILLALVCLGCQATPTDMGRAEVSASHHLRTLTTDLPMHARVGSVVAASDAALRARGYAVISRNATEDSGSVVGRAPGSWSWERIVVRARVVPGSTRVTVTVEPIGDKSTAEAILDDVLRRLGT